MKIKTIQIEDFVNYKLPSMFIGTSTCNWKCCKEQGLDSGVCQNAPLSKQPTKDVNDLFIYEQFVNNPITKAVVIGGLEPMLQIDEVESLINTFRTNNENCVFVIYTGYYPDEIKNELTRLKKYGNIIVKFGRYIPNKPNKYDDVLGVTLASDNQYAEVIC